jgi:hypothetical protein
MPVIVVEVWTRGGNHYSYRHTCEKVDAFAAADAIHDLVKEMPRRKYANRPRYSASHEGFVVSDRGVIMGTWREE